MYTFFDSPSIYLAVAVQAIWLGNTELVDPKQPPLSVIGNAQYLVLFAQRNFKHCVCLNHNGIKSFQISYSIFRLTELVEGKGVELLDFFQSLEPLVGNGNPYLQRNSLLGKKHLINFQL